MKNYILLTLLILLVISCGKAEKTKLEILFDELQKKADSSQPELSKAFELGLNAIIRSTESSKKFKEHIKTGKADSDKIRQTMKMELLRNKEDRERFTSITAPILRTYIKIVSLEAISFEKCGSKEVDEKALQLFETFAKNNYYSDKSVLILDLYKTNKKIYGIKLNRYNFSDDCAWLNKKKNDIIEEYEKKLRMINGARAIF